MSKVEGLAETYSLLDHLPQAAEDELAVEMAILGREILAAQQADVAKDTGKLSSALTLQLLLDRLKIRVGLIGQAARTFNGGSYKAKTGGPFYGRFVEFGRAAQTVVVTRRIKQRRLIGNNRKGNTRQTIYGGASKRLRRRGPNAGTPIGSPYKMRVKGKAGRPFVAQPLLQETASSLLSDFWANALKRLGGSA